jgi:hypothetical protein
VGQGQSNREQGCRFAKVAMKVRHWLES